MKHIIYLFTITLLALSCSETKEKLPENFDYGNIENGLYKNAYFDMEISFNPNWTVQNKEQINTLIEQHGTTASVENEDFKAIIKASQINTAYLLTVFKYDIGSSVAFNPSFMAIAENTKNFNAIHTGKDYLFHAKKLMQKTEMQYSFNSKIAERTISNAVFHVMETQLHFDGKTILQEYISTVSKGFSLSFVITYATEDEKEALYAIINSIKIQKNNSLALQL